MEPQQQSKKPCKPKVCRAFLVLAERTGLEPATPGVTGRYSNQLNYRCVAKYLVRSHELTAHTLLV